MKTYICNCCKKELEVTTGNFFPSSIKNAKLKNRNYISKCRSCANAYSASWRKSLKDNNLVRSRRTSKDLAKAVNGILYIIGTVSDGNPYKIGITSGLDMKKRKSALQTAHWVELKIVWTSSLIQRVDKLEKIIHDKFHLKRVKGEWFDIDKTDIEEIKNISQHFLGA
jgi:hypothetical protein